MVQFHRQDAGHEGDPAAGGLEPARRTTGGLVTPSSRLVAPALARTRNHHAPDRVDGGSADTGAGVCRPTCIGGIRVANSKSSSPKNRYLIQTASASRRTTRRSAVISTGEGSRWQPVRRPPLLGPMNRIGARVHPRGVRPKKGVYPGEVRPLREPTSPGTTVPVLPLGLKDCDTHICTVTVRDYA